MRPPRALPTAHLFERNRHHHYMRDGTLYHFIYQSEEYKFGSAEHHQLVKAAIRASLEQNPEIAETLRLTYPRPIEHDTGRLENPGTALPGSKFVQILEEIRQELIHAAR